MAKLTPAAGGLGDGAGGRHRRGRRPGRRDDGVRRHRDRRRELLLPRRHRTRPPSSRSGASTTSTSARRGGVFGLERGFCLMVGGEDDVVAHLDPIFATLAPGIDAAPRTPAATGPNGSTAEQGYLHCGPNGAGPLREDGPQRDRVRDHGRLRRGARHPPKRRRRRARAHEPTPRRPRWRRPSTTSTRSTRPRWPRCGGGLGGRRRGCSTSRRPRSSRTPTSPASPAASRTPARAAGRRSRRSRRACPPTCSRPRSSSGSARATRASSRNKLLSAMRKQFGGHAEKTTA